MIAFLCYFFIPWNISYVQQMLMNEQMNGWENQGMNHEKNMYWSSSPFTFIILFSQPMKGIYENL